MFEDIDTPISESELAGEPTAEEVAALEAIAGEGGEWEGKAGEESGDPAAAEAGAAASADAAAAGETDPEGQPAADDKGGKDQPQQRSPVIPRARFDEVNSRLHEEREEKARLQAELEALKAEKTAAAAKAEAVDLVALRKEILQATLDGDIETAADLEAKRDAELERRAEERAFERLNKQAAEKEAERAANEAARQFNETVAKTLAAHPYLDSNSDAANPKAIADVVEWRDFYMNKGEPAHVALEKAVAKVSPLYGPAQAPAAAAPAADPRKAAAIARNAIDAAAQPAAPVAGVGNRAVPPVPKIDTQDDWEKLPEAEREKLLMGA